jgi:hypothetical protein
MVKSQTPLPGWPPAAQLEAWFAAWNRAIRSGVPGAADVAAAQLQLLGVEVRLASPHRAITGGKDAIGSPS